LICAPATGSRQDGFSQAPTHLLWWLNCKFNHPSCTVDFLPQLIVNKMNRAVKIFVGIVILGALSFFAYKNLITWQKESLEKAVRQEQQFWQDKTSSLEKDIRLLQQELESIKSPTYPKDKATEAFGKEPGKVIQKERKVSFEEIEREIASFFRYLDNQAYIASYDLKGGTYKEYQKAVDSLSKNPPIITGEIDSLHRLLKNMAHLFRISGKNRIKLANDILNNESDIIEPVMSKFCMNTPVFF
jgi:hypothetical protein